MQLQKAATPLKVGHVTLSYCSWLAALEHLRVAHVCSLQLYQYNLNNGEVEPNNTLTYVLVPTELVFVC